MLELGVFVVEGEAEGGGFAGFYGAGEEGGCEDFHVGERLVVLDCRDRCFVVRWGFLSDYGNSAAETESRRYEVSQRFP